VTTAAADVLERDWQRTVLDTARTRGWRCAHFRAARTSKGWRTPVQADGQGFVDLVLVRGDRIEFVELKTETGRLTEAQAGWLAAVALVAETNPGVAARVWRPSGWDLVVEVLR
jgi:hypothetical protein